MPEEPEVVTFGCRLNTYESAHIERMAQHAGLKDTVIINTCAVTAEAERQAQQAIRRLKRQRPHARLLVTGCAAQIRPETYASMKEVAAVLGNDEKLSLEALKASRTIRLQVSPHDTLSSMPPGPLHNIPGRTRGFVEIQNGCDHRCTFCVIPYGRGPSRSVPASHIITQMRSFLDAGYKDITLTGVDMTAYGQDLSPSMSLGQLTKTLLKACPDLPRLRLSSLDCSEIDEALWDALAHEERLMPHIHLSLQAGDPMILKRMKRRHSREDALKVCQRLYRIRPDIVLGADLIAGFPTETEAMFERTFSLVRECQLTWLHVFTYSPRHGTPAARITRQVPESTKRERALRLRRQGLTHQKAFFERQVGAQQTVLFETETTGKSPQFAPIVLEGGRVERGSLLQVKIAKSCERHLEATLLS